MLRSNVEHFLLKHVQNGDEFATHQKVTDRKILNSDYSSLAYNFDFTSTGNTGWVLSGCSGSTVSLSSGKLRINPGSACAFSTSKEFQVAPNKPYNISFELNKASQNVDVEIYVSTSPTAGVTGSPFATITNPANGMVSYSFTTGSTINYVRINLKKNSTESTSYNIDNLQISTVASPYMAMVVMTSDYYPYGYQMPGRHTNDPNYRYGYNGMEKNAEMYGEGNEYSTEFRQYDPRLGRWMSLDPLMAKYPNMSPYVAFNDNPVYFVDPLGLEGGKGRRAERRGHRAASRDRKQKEAKANKAAEIEHRNSKNRIDEIEVTAKNGSTKMGRKGINKPVSDQIVKIPQRYSSIKDFVKQAKDRAAASQGKVLPEGNDWDYINYYVFGEGRSMPPSQGSLGGTLQVDPQGYPRVRPVTGTPPDIGFKGSVGAIKKVNTLSKELNVIDDIVEEVPWEKISGILRDASKNKGNFGLGSGSFNEAMEAGKSWVGKGYKTASDGKTLISSDGLRQFRPPSFKPKLGKTQANFEWRNINKGQWQGNGHLDVLP